MSRRHRQSPRWGVPRRWVVTCARQLRLLARARAITPPGEPLGGVTARDVRAIAERHGYFSSGGHDRSGSWFAAVPRVARLRNSGRRVIGPSGNDHVIWTI